jgi:kinetochore protein Nuf2
MATVGKQHWRPFPELKGMEILQIMEELRIPLTEADLTKPVPGQIQRVYEAFVELYMGSHALQTCQASTQPSFAAIDVLEYPEIHLDAIQLMTFYRTVATLMENVGIDDFSLKDVIKPEPMRIKMILSGLINFAKFREEQLSLFESHSAKHDAALAQKKKLENQYQSVQDKLASLQAQHTKEESLIQDLEKTLSGMTNTLKQLKKDQTSITDQVGLLKDTKEQLNDQLASYQFTLMNLKQDCTKLQNRIVQNPEVLIQTLADLSEEIKREKSSLASLEQDSSVLQLQLDQVISIDQDLSKCLAIMNESYALLQARSDLESSIAALQDNQAKQTTILEDSQSKYQQLERQQAALVEKLDKLKQHQRSKRDMVNESLQSLKEEYETMCQERQSIQDKVDQNDVRIKEIEVKVGIFIVGYS